MRVNFSSGTPWEPLRGYSRAVEVNDTLYISGTTALTDDGEVVGFQSPYKQAKFVLDRIVSIAKQCGYSSQEIIQTRLYITNMKHWTEVARAHHEHFTTIRPASSLVEVSKLRDPRLVVEIEATAVRGATVKETRIIS